VLLLFALGGVILVKRSGRKKEEKKI